MRIVPRSHTCPSCLTELGRIRAAPDPHYGLPVVVCPSCSLATVRQRHPDIEFWRNFRRVLGAIRNVLVRLGLTIVAGLLFALLVMVSHEMFTPGDQLAPEYPFTSGDPRMAIGGGMMFGLSTLLMMTVVMLYRHRSVVFGIVLLGVLTLYLITVDIRSVWTISMLEYVFDFQSDSWEPESNELRLRMMRFGLFGGVSLLGIVPAVLLGGIVDRSRGRRFRRLLNKRRKQRRIHD